MRPLLLALPAAGAIFVAGVWVGGVGLPTPEPAALPALPAARMQLIAPARSPAPPRPAAELGARRPLPAAAPATASASAAAAPFELAAWLPARTSPSEVELCVTLLLELERPLEALAVLRAHPRAPAYSYADTAVALSGLGQRAEATELFEQALIREPEDEWLLDAFLEHDRLAGLRAVERLGRVQRALDADFELDPGLRARALFEEGRTVQAVALLPPLESYCVAASGCIPTHFSGEDWEVEIWRAADPVGLRDVLLQVVAQSSTSQERVLVQLAAVCTQLGERATFEAALAEHEQRHGSDSALLAELAPVRGWSEVRELWLEQPYDQAATFGLGAHYLEQGRAAEAQELFDTFLDSHHTQDVELPEAWELLEFVELGGARFLTSIERQIASLLARGDETGDPSWELGVYAELYWSLGDERRAAELWHTADRLDPEGLGWGAEQLRLYELGVLE